MKSVDILSFSELKTVDLDCLFAMNQYWREGYRFVMKKPRPTNGILWFCGCNGRFKKSDGKQLLVNRGSTVYIPMGSTYEIVFENCESRPCTVLLEFALMDKESFSIDGGIRVIDNDLGDKRIPLLLEKLVVEYSKPTRSYFKMKRDVYEILYLMCEIEKRRHINRRGFATIEKGIEYLQKDERQTLSIDEIAKMCFVSPAYFRRLFKEFSGYSPTEYRNRQKIERAKNLIEHTDVSVVELSELLGFSDPSYFCRVFKKAEGVSPSKYQKKKDLF